MKFNLCRNVRAAASEANTRETEKYITRFTCNLVYSEQQRASAHISTSQTFQCTMHLVHHLACVHPHSHTYSNTSDTLIHCHGTHYIMHIDSFFLRYAYQFDPILSEKGWGKKNKDDDDNSTTAMTTMIAAMLALLHGSTNCAENKCVHALINQIYEHYVASPLFTSNTTPHSHHTAANEVVSKRQSSDKAVMRKATGCG